MNYTRSPWMATNDKGHQVIYAVTQEICEIDPKTHANSEANARLIAAAPELLEACHLTLSYLLEPMPNIEAAKKELLNIIHKTEAK